MIKSMDLDLLTTLGRDLYNVWIALSSCRFRFSHEQELVLGIAEALDIAGIYYEREVRLSKADRLDFLTADGTCIEVKVDGSFAEAARQVYRYSMLDRVLAIIVVTSRSVHREMPEWINGKPVRVLHVRPGL